MRHHVRLELAQSREFPRGNARCGYELELPLTSDSRLDRDGWQSHRHGHKALRFWDGLNDQTGRLWRNREGWFVLFGYGEASEEAIISETSPRFALGKLIRITEFDGQPRTFRVVAITTKKSGASEAAA